MKPPLSFTQLFKRTEPKEDLNGNRNITNKVTNLPDFVASSDKVRCELKTASHGLMID